MMFQIGKQFNYLQLIIISDPESNKVAQMEQRKPNLSPLQLMQRFYNDYNKPKNLSSAEQPDARHSLMSKTNNTDKMTKFLSQYQKRQRGVSTTLQSELKYSSNSQYRTITPSRYRSNAVQEPKRCYFKSLYSQSHPFLISSHKISQKQVNQFKNIKTEPVQSMNNSNLLHDRKLMTPLESRNTIKQIKQTMIRIKNHKKQRMQKLRYNYLVTNCYKGHKSNNEPQLSRIRMSQLNTKQRIFPTFTSTANIQTL